MSNIDSLLDLGDSDPPPQGTAFPGDSGQSPPPGFSDPFDPFGPAQPVNKDLSGGFTDFDPFATIEPTSPEGPEDYFGGIPVKQQESSGFEQDSADFFGDERKSPEFGNNNIDLLGEDNMAADMSESDQKVYEQQFDDLLGGLSGKGEPDMNGHSGEQDILENGEIATMSEEPYMEVNGSHTSDLMDEPLSPEKAKPSSATRGSSPWASKPKTSPIVNTPTSPKSTTPMQKSGSPKPTGTVAPKSHTGITPKNVSVEQPNKNKAPKFQLTFPKSGPLLPPAIIIQDEDEGSDAPISSDASDKMSEGEPASPIPSSHSPRSPKSPSWTEDTLPDFQPPKRYVKPEEKQSKGPGVIIMEGKRAPTTSTRGHSPQSARSDSPAKCASPVRPADSASQPVSVGDQVTEFDFQPSQEFGSLLARWKYEGATGDMMCKLCQKRVYEMEKIIADKAIYHKTCFKCTHCKRVLSLGNFASLEGKLYCKPHFIEIFKTKGNYEEGFGMERHAKQWSKDIVSPDYEENNLQASQEILDGHSGKDVVRAEDKPEESFEALPSIRNIKSRFENQDESPPLPVDHSRSTSQRSQSPGRSLDSSYNGEAQQPARTPSPVNPEEELPQADTTRNLVARFRDIQSGDSQYERKPVRKMTPPRDELAEGIHQMQRSVSENEPVHDPSVVRSGEDISKEEELPPPAFTRTMLAKFKSLEDEVGGSPAPAPARSPRTSSTKQPQIRAHSKSSPDSGISDNESGHAHNGHKSDEETLDGVVKSGDKTQEEKEMPETGTTKSLLAQWKAKEQTSKAQPSPVSRSPRASTRQWGGGRPASQSPASNARKQFKWEVKEVTTLRGRGSRETTPRKVSVGSQDERDSEVERESAPSNGMNGDDYHSQYREYSDEVEREEDESSKNNEEELPPPALTRNLLAKFKSMEDVNAAAPTPERSARLQKAAASSRSPGPTRKFSSPSKTVEIYSDEREQPDGLEEMERSHEDEQYPQYDVAVDAGEYENEPLRNSDIVREEDKYDEEELPEQGMTRNLLAKFQSLQA